MMKLYTRGYYEILLGLLLLIFLVGCAVPSAKYKDFTKKDTSDFDGYSKFVLQTSAIHARLIPKKLADEPAEPKEQAEPKKASGSRTPSKTALGQSAPNKEKDESNPFASFKFESVPQPLSNAKYGMKDSGSDLWVKTEVKLKTRENSDLVERIEVELFDNRMETITTLGAIAAKAVAMGSEPRRSGEVTLVFDLPSEMKDAKAESFKLTIPTVNPPDETYSNWKAELDIGEIPNDAILRSTFDPTKHNHVFFYSACRDAQIKLLNDENKVVAYGSLRISDPNYLQTIAFPRKGVISVTSECGVNVTSEHKVITKETALFDELIKQIQSTLDAAKNKKGKASKDTGKKE